MVGRCLLAHLDVGHHDAPSLRQADHKRPELRYSIDIPVAKIKGRILPWTLREGCVSNCRPLLDARSGGAPILAGPVDACVEI